MLHSPLPRRRFIQTCGLALAGGWLGTQRMFAEDAPKIRFEHIDAHAHYPADTPDALELMGRLKLKTLNVCVGRSTKIRGITADNFRGLAQAHPERFGWCTSIDAPDFKSRDYPEKTIQQLDEDFAQGAVACKVWKNFGLELKTPEGAYFMVDDPLLEPIFSHIEKSGRTLLMHSGEPLEAWQPLNPNGVYQQYYQNHPEYHFYTIKGIPSHAEVMRARDRVVERHPKMRVVGAHFASLESDVMEIAKRFEQYPNFCVDSSGLGRARSLSMQDRNTVRDFFQKYSDRILFGTDLVAGEKLSKMEPDQREAFRYQLNENIVTAEKYYASSEQMKLRGGEVQGLGLPEKVLTQFFRENARRVYPGL